MAIWGRRTASVAFALLAGCYQSTMTPLDADSVPEAQADASVERDAAERDAGAVAQDAESDAASDAEPEPTCAPSGCDDGLPGTLDTCAENACVHVEDPVVQVSTGHSHACVRRSSGRVACWGANGFNANATFLGDPSFTRYESRMARTMPYFDGIETRAIDVDAGNQWSCAVRSDARVVCWGVGTEWDGAGNLGDGNTASRATPVLVLLATGEPLEGVTRVSAGGTHACARREDGSVVCWGTNVPELHATQVSDPLGRARVVPGIADAVSVRVGIWHTCVLHATGHVSCWGRNNDAQLARPSATLARSAVPLEIPGLDDAVEISTGAEFTCARRATGSVVCWGATLNGQLGAPSATLEESALLLTVEGLTDAIAISTGYGHACSVRLGGEGLCWGDHSSGQLGAGRPLNTPHQRVALEGLVAIEASTLFTCALDAQHRTFCFGSDQYAPLGHGPTEHGLPGLVEGL